MKAIILNKWNEYLKFFKDNQKDIYYFEDYVKLYEDKDTKSFCAVCQDGNKILLMPFLRKKIDNYFDFETAYGYGGPITNVDDVTWINLALDEIYNLFKREKYICGFIRFHPLLNNAFFCKNHIQVFFDRNTIAINTDESNEEIWTNQITSKNRNMIRKARKNGLIYKAEYDFESINKFVSLYNQTMDRLNANTFYYFNQQYYAEFSKNFKNKAFLGTIRKNDELICAALFMFSNIYGHYHLEGSNHEYSKLAANNLLLWESALEFQKLGIKEFHLGGGYDGDPQNSLFKFKKSFSNNMKDFFIGKWIFNEEKYTELKNDWSNRNPHKVEKFGNFLLCYRY